ncbi:MAG: glycosyltransferase [Patescibacteria group bacterium]
MAMIFRDIPLFLFLFFSLYVQVFLLITFFEMRREKKRGGNIMSLLMDAPKVDIIVPCWNEEATLERTVDSLLNLEYPEGKLRIIVVNDGSTDRTGVIADNLAARFGSVTALHKENGGKYTALNLGLEYATAQLVGCLDADSFVSPGALKEIIPHFGNPKVMAVTPYITVHEPRGTLQRVQSAEYVMSGFFLALLAALNALFVTPGPFSIYRKAVFERIGGFRSGHHTEDLEMAFRMQANRMKIENASGARVATIAPSSFSSLMRQRVRWHYGFLNNALDYRRLIARPGFGHLGFFILPGGVISIFAALFLAAVSVFDGLSRLRNFVVETLTVGFRFGQLHFEWFFFNTSVFSLVTFFVLAVFLFLFLSSRWFADGKFRLPKNGVWYLLLYGFLAPVWYARAVYAALTARTVFWR